MGIRREGAWREIKDMSSHRWTQCRVWAAACILLSAAGGFEAGAQFLPMPGQASPAAGNPFPPPPAPGRSGAGQASPFPPPGANQNVCASFPALREDAEKGAMAIQEASKRRASREEVCPLFKRFAAKEAQLIKFLVTNQATCGVPPQAIKQAQANHAKTIQIRNQVCAAGPAGPAGPSLSDALGGPIIADDTSVQPGRGTFDTLTGNALAR